MYPPVVFPGRHAEHGLFYGGLILGALLLTVSRFYPGFYSSLPLAPPKAWPLLSRVASG